MQASRMLRYARRRSGLTQTELAHRAGVPHSTVARIELGHTSPRVDTLTNLLHECGFDLEAVPRLGRGLDRSLIRESIKASPRERVEVVVADAAAMDELGR